MKWVEGKTTEKSVFAICPKSVYLDLSLLYLLLIPDPISLLLRNYSLFIPQDAGPSMAQKAKVFLSSHNGKGTSLRRGEGGFAAANPRPLISGFLVRCGEGDLRRGEVLHRGEGGLRNGEPVTLCDAAFSSFLLLLCFFCLLAALLIPTSPYSIE